MKKKGILLVLAAVIVLTGFVSAAEPGDLGVTLEATYLSRFIFRGLDYFPNNHSAFRPSVNVDLWGTGFGMNVAWTHANSGGFENLQRMDYSIFYQNKMWEGESYQTNYELGYVYYNHPDNPSYLRDFMEVYGSFAWPRLLPCNLVPSYTAISTWESDGDQANVRSGMAGWVHVFGLGYNWTVPGFTPGTTEQVFHFTADAVYNDGAYAPTVDNDWSHAVFGVSTAFDVTDNVKFTPGVYYQSSWEDTVNTSDEYWTSLSLSYAF